MDPVTFAQARLDEAERETREMLRTAQETSLELKEPKLLGKWIPGWRSWPKVEAMCVRMLRDVEAGRAILADLDRLGTSWEPGSARIRLMHDAVVRNLAAAWSDHPDYDPAWKPEP